MATVNTPSATPLPAALEGPLYWLCSIYTWALLALNAVEMFGGKAPHDDALSTVYLALLTAYAGNKEIGKWSDPALEQTLPNRHGERFVAAWNVLFWGGMVLVTVAHPIVSGHGVILVPELHVPHALLANYLTVIGVFFGTKISRGRRTGEPILKLPGKTRSPAHRAPAKRAPAEGAQTNVFPAQAGTQTAIGRLGPGFRRGDGETRRGDNAPRSLDGAPLSNEAQIGLLGGVVAGELVVCLEAEGGTLFRLARRLYDWAAWELFDSALEQLLAKREIEQVTPGPRGPKTVYRLSD